MKKQLAEKAVLISRFPNNPIIRGSYFKARKTFAKLSKYKKRKFIQNILDKLDQLNEDNPKEYWNLVASIREAKENNKEKNEKGIEPDTWHTYFNNLFKLPDRHSERLEIIHNKIMELENKP